MESTNKAIAKATEMLQNVNEKEIQQKICELTFAISHETRFTVTPEIAAYIVLNMRYNNQRSLRNMAIENYAYDMIHGTWRAGSQMTFCFCDFPERKESPFVLINGYHRICAIIISGRDAQFQLRNEIAKSEKELDDAYCFCDMPGAKRTILDQHKAQGMILTPNARINEIYTKACIIVHNHMKRPMYQNEPILCLNRSLRDRIASEYLETGKLFLNMFKETNTMYKQHFQTIAVFASAIITLHDCTELAKEFWDGLLRNEITEKGDPRRSLFAKLCSHESKRDINLCIAWISVGWNAFYDKRKIYSRITAHEYHKREIKFKGTRYE